MHPTTAFFISRFVAALLLLCGLSAVAAPAGRPLPALQATLLDGQELRLNQAPGRVTLISYWATWCPSCIKEMPELDRLYRQYHAAGLDVLGVSMDEPEDREKVRQFARGLQIPVAMEAEVKAGALGKIWAVPLLFIVDRQGRLQGEGWAGLQEKDFPALEKTVRELLAEQP